MKGGVKKTRRRAVVPSVVMPVGDPGDGAGRAQVALIGAFGERPWKHVALSAHMNVLTELAHSNLGSLPSYLAAADPMQLPEAERATFLRRCELLVEYAADPSAAPSRIPPPADAQIPMSHEALMQQYWPAVSDRGENIARAAIYALSELVETRLNRALTMPADVNEAILNKYDSEDRQRVDDVLERYGQLSEAEATRLLDQILPPSLREVTENMVCARDGHLEETCAPPHSGTPVSRAHMRKMLQPPEGAQRPCRKLQDCLSMLPPGTGNTQSLSRTDLVLPIREFLTPDEVAAGVTPARQRACIICSMYDTEMLFHMFSAKHVEPPYTLNPFCFAAGDGVNEFPSELMLPEYTGPNNEQRTGIKGAFLQFSRSQILLVRKGGASYAGFAHEIKVPDF